MPKVGEGEVRGILKTFDDLPDPRSHVNRHHLLLDVIVMSVLAVIAGADGPVAIEQWAKINRRWLRRHLKLPHGIASHDTIGRVLEALQPRAFQECFADWLKSLVADGIVEAERLHIAIDGKTLRRSHDKRHGLGPLHVVSALATQHGITLGQLATEEKSNEITAIPELLEQLDLKGAVLTIDAAGCQKNIARQIVDGEADYVLALKGNQETLHRAVADYITDHLEDDFARVRVSRFEEKEKGHGRQEHRLYYQLNAPADLAGRDKWRGLKTIGIAIRIYTTDGEERFDVRHYISSLRRNAKTFAKAVRGHWAVENTLHWCLDMTFREDESRARGRNLSNNLAWLRRMALSLLKQHSSKQSVAMKRRMSAWSVDFLTEVLTGQRT
jgi:predicted transposase YbfD/YdcC